MQELLGEAREAPQRGRDGAGAVAGRALGQFGDEALGLRQRGGDRRSEFMGAVGREAALGFERAAQALHQSVDRRRDGRDLVRQPSSGDGREIAAATRFDRPAEGDHGLHGQPDREPHAKQGDGHEGDEGPDQGGHGAPDRRLAVAQVLGGGDENGSPDRGLGIGAQPVGGMVAGREAARNVHEVGSTGLEQFAPLFVADHIGDVFPVGTDRRHVLGRAAIFTREQLGIGEGEHPLRDFLQRAVEHFINLAAQHQAGHRRGGEPQSRDRDGEP